MTKKFYRTKEFVKLQNEWYDKLTDQGFSDLEWYCRKTGQGHSTPFLKDHALKYRRLDAKEVENVLEYYSTAQDFTNNHKFPSRLHKYVWQLHTEGIPYRKMIPKIRSRGFKHVPSIFWISYHLKRLKHAFRLWKLDQPAQDETWDDFMRSNNSIDNI